jgi:hypothetical protein
VEVLLERGHAMMNRFCFGTLGLSACALFFCLGIASSVLSWNQAAAAQAQIALPAPPIPVQEMQVAAYSKEFAKRFSLPDPEPGFELSPPVHGLRFSIELLHMSRELNVPVYGCRLQVYFDKTLPVAFPTEAKTWSRRIYGPYSQRWLLNKPGPKLLPDKMRIADKESMADRLVAIGTPNYEWGKPGYYATHFVNAFDREFVPGLAYMEIGVLCPSPAAVTNPAGLDLWVKKEGAPDFRTARMDYNAFLKSPIPKAMLGLLEPWLSWQREYTLVLGREEARINRERRK